MVGIDGMEGYGNPVIDLQGADLRVANLTDTDLGGANVSLEQIAQTGSLRGTILPDGTLQSRAP